MLSALETARDDVARQLEGADPDRVTGAQAAALMTVFAEIERLGAAGKVLFSKRASESMTWRDEGHRSAAAWMASTTGTGVGEALAALETSVALGSLPGTTDALRRGELSGSQVKVIAGAAASDPRAEAGLLEAAATRSLKGLKAAAAGVRAVAGSADEEKARYLALHRSRYLRHWTEADGALRLDARLTPDAGARLLSSLQVEADVRFHEARKSATYESPAAYSADALVALATGEPAAVFSKHNAPRAGVVIRVDAKALKRGHVRHGEVCEIPGVGSVPVAAVHRQLSDAWVKIVVLDGKDVTTVCHVGRSVPAHLQSALEERDAVCVVPDCEVGHGLENHHWDVPYAECGTSTLAGVARVCSWHHGLATYEGWVLTRRAGSWEWRAPPGGCRFETGTVSPKTESRDTG